MYLDQVTFEQLKTAELSRVICLLPVGNLEAHGPHLPLGTDNLIPARLAERVEAGHADEVAVAPPIPYGHNWELRAFPGTVNVGGGTLARFVVEVGTGLAASGFRVVVLWNGHGGNVPALTEACEQLAERGLTTAVLTWWIDFAAEIRRHVGSQGHAGADELSVLMATDPSLVRPAPAGENMRRFHGIVRAPGIGERLYPQVFSGRPAEAAAAAGEAMLEDLTAAVWRRLAAIRDGDWFAAL